MDPKNQRPLDKTLWSLVLVLAACFLFFFAVLLLLRDYRELRSSGIIAPPSNIGSFRELYRAGHTQPLAIEHIDTVQGWMTFDYLSRAFAIPVDYFQTKLNIAEKKFPNVSIDATAKFEHIAKADYLATVKHALRDYLSSPQTP